MKFPGRNSIRLSGYDYARPGFYFVTTCVSRRECLLGAIVDGTMQLNVMGDIVSRVWHDLPRHYLNIVLDAFVVMPNHFHGIVHIVDPSDISFSITDHDAPLNTSLNVGDGLKPSPTDANVNASASVMNVNRKNHALPEIIRGFKTFSSRNINTTVASGYFRWQRSYHERIIRDDEELNRIRLYIQTNPLFWEIDQFFS